jgi:tripeptide aminopeptidase
MKQELLNRFLRYVQIDTQSDENSKTYPSTSKQFDLANLLVKELREIVL